MKRTVWEIDGGVLTLEYHHDSEEMFIEEKQNSMNSKTQQIALDDECLVNLCHALAELKGLRKDIQAGKALSTLREAM